MKNSRAFTMIELVFVIVVLGILAGIAIPKMVVTRDDAMIAKGKSQVAAIRSGVALQRSRNLLQGTNAFPAKLDDANASGANLFYFSDGNTSNILEYPVQSVDAAANNGWIKTNTTTYTFRVSGKDTTFTYNPATGSFSCAIAATNDCETLTK